MRFDDGDGVSPGDGDRQAALLLYFLFLHTFFRTTGNFFGFRLLLIVLTVIIYEIRFILACICQFTSCVARLDSFLKFVSLLSFRKKKNLI